MDDTEIVVTEENFSEHFKEAGKQPPKRGEVLAIFRAVAELVDGDLKRDIINKLQNEDGGVRFAIQVLIKACKMSYRESLKICKEIMTDLESQSIDEVLAKPYKFLYENKYFVKKELVPQNSPHWEIVSLKSVTVTEKNSDSELQKTEQE
jgi:hypothetical protein